VALPAPERVCLVVVVVVVVVVVGVVVSVAGWSVLLALAPPTEAVRALVGFVKCGPSVGGVTVAAVPPRMMLPALHNSVKHGHTVALTLMGPSSEL